MNFISYSILGFVLSLLLVVIIMPSFINVLKKKNYQQVVSEYSLKDFKEKAKTPIMGGLLFVVVPCVVFLALSFDHQVDAKVYACMLSYVLFGLVGFWDDITIIIKQSNKGVKASYKLLAQLIFTLLIYFIFKDNLTTIIHIPLTNLSFDLGIMYIPFMIIVYLGLSNACNFTDGMDGLCAGVSIIQLIGFALVCLLMLKTDLFIFITMIAGSLIAYLYFNHRPARIFMGDSGSLALGGLFASLIIFLDKELALAIICFVFIWEMLCVVIQQIAVRLFHKRVFSYTPIHYAFTLKGKSEIKVVNMFYLIAAVFTVIGTIVALL